MHSLKVGASGSFGGNLHASDFGTFSLSLANHRHTQTAGNHFGGGAITTPGFGGSAPLLTPNTTGSVPIANLVVNPSVPTVADLGKNDGGGTQMETDPNPINIVFPNEVNDLESTNQTKLAKRKHKKESIGRNRKEKPLM